MSRLYANRREAGRALAQRLLREHLPAPLCVLALPRGGVPVAAEVARALGAPLDLVLVRKIGAPWQPELAVAALVDGTPPQVVLAEDIAAQLGIDRRYIDEQARLEADEIERRRRVYLRGRAPLDVAGRTVIVVDDGLATGTTMRAALRALRTRRPALLVMAVPVAPSDTLAALAQDADRTICLQQPDPFHAVGLHYDDFHQVDDDEVLAALDAAAATARQP